MQVSEGREIPDPPLLRLENEAGRAYLSMLTTLYMDGLPSVREAAKTEGRLLQHCSVTLDSFEVSKTHQTTGAGVNKPAVRTVQLNAQCAHARWQLQTITL